MAVDQHVRGVQPVAAVLCVLGIVSVLVAGVLLVPEHQCGRHRGTGGVFDRSLHCGPNSLRFGGGPILTDDGASKTKATTSSPFSTAQQ